MSIGHPPDCPAAPQPPSLRTALRDSPGVVRLAVVRFAGQFGDGMFQAALSGAILFNPERHTDPLAIAAGFAVLLLPYSLIGPYAGALLDRWDRRAVLLLANMVRAVLIGIAAAGLLAGIGETPLLLLALAVVGVSRFVQAGVSAALPRVLDQHWLVAMNSALATVASGCAGVGAGAAVAVIGVVGAGDTGSAVAVAGSAVGSVIGAVLSVGFRAGVLGPGPAARADRRRTEAGADVAVADTSGRAASGETADAGRADDGAVTGSETAGVDRGTVRAIAAGLRTAASAVWAAPSVTTAMIGIGTHRVVFGANTLIMVLVLRQPADGSALGAGLIGFGVAIAATAAGMLVAAVVAPLVIPRLGRPRTVVVGLVGAMLVQLLLVTPTALAGAGAAGHRAHQLLLVGAFLFGLAGQTIKLTGDAAMQIDIDDRRRGQVFALQDTVFNLAFVAAIALTALVVPADGRSLPVVLAGAAGYGLGVVLVAVNSRRTGQAR
ncbi:acylglycerophosphoethanolamine acyltransferase [Nocardia farcinica]|uniref:Acylglycerophosphoethanolamine acyltransferase n=1 Tax=Nocardia farcinica TaxID=37329 RepID=A0A449GL45_NOCFR|nr:MFS transporter [Nocardia farcinica]VFA93369.1 acylglycerophosphoethanolamine acyltransferase [Nocardia farcinica]